MSILLENICFASDECLRLLHWQGNARTLQSLDAGGQRIPVAGVGGRWHSHAEMEFTIVLRGSGMRYVGDHVGAFSEMDCVLLGSHLPHCWMESGPTDGYVLQFHLPSEHPLRRMGGANELHRLFAAAERGLWFAPQWPSKGLQYLNAWLVQAKWHEADCFCNCSLCCTMPPTTDGVTQSDPRLCRR